MAEPRENRPYRWLAEHYDRLFLPYRGPFAAARAHALGRLLPSLESACDLACGTGTTALEFARQGLRTYGVDLSPVMCRLAREKARKAGLPLLVLSIDMRRFRLPQRVQLVTCEYDALNHVPRKEDLQQVARAVARALEPGGWFFFDVNNRKAFVRYWTGTVWVEQDGLVMVLRSDHDAAGDRAWSDVEWFVREGRHWRRHSERVEEVCWSGAEIRTALRLAGFDSVRAWDALRFFPGDPRMRAGCRTFYLARRGQW